MYRERTAEEILMDDIKMYHEENYSKGGEKNADRNERLLYRAEKIIDKMELYLKTIRKFKEEQYEHFGNEHFGKSAWAIKLMQTIEKELKNEKDKSR